MKPPQTLEGVGGVEEECVKHKQFCIKSIIQNLKNMIFGTGYFRKIIPGTKKEEIRKLLPFSKAKGDN